MDLKTIKVKAKRIACLALAAGMVLSFTSGSYTSNSSFPTVDSNVGATGEKTVTFSNVTSSMDLSDIQISNFSSDVLKNTTSSQSTTATVIIELDGDSLMSASAGDTVASFMQTSDGRRVMRQIANQQDDLYDTLDGLGINYKQVTEYDTVANAVAVKMNTSYVSRVKNISGVKGVYVSNTYAAPKSVESEQNAAVNATNVYSTGIYDSSAYSEQYGGKGMVVAILDTGLDYTHDAFQKLPEGARMDESDVNDIMAGGMHASGDVYLSQKVPFAYDYADKDTDVYPSSSNHGTHVAGIIGGNDDSYTDKEGNIAKDENGQNIPFVSSAPDSQLVICKVFSDNLDESVNSQGATTEDILSALEDCIKLGVDVINMSLGTSAGFSTTDDGDFEGDWMNTVYDNVGKAGISLICAASNDYSSGYGSNFGTNLTSNPDSGTVGSPSTYASALSVASISGKKSEYILANGTTPVFYQESSDENNVDYDFAEQMLSMVGASGTATFKYVHVGGVGLSADYTRTVTNAIKNAHDNGEKIIALVKRGKNTFQEKVETAMANGADAVIIYNNVSGEIKMTIGDIDNPVPTISIDQESGEAMVKGAKNRVGEITINTNYLAGPFMSDFSSWGVTPDLKLKPEITAHGGEITSTVPGGYGEQSGTSMASPNVAGLMANVRNYITANYDDKFADYADGDLSKAQNINRLANQLMMSTATIVIDKDKLAYSPRKQGAGLASLDNIINTNAYLYTRSGDTVNSAHGTYTGASDDRAKIEIGEDEGKVGKYTLRFYARNMSSTPLNFVAESLFMTEGLSVDKLAVAEQAYMLKGNAVWKIGSNTYADGDTITLSANSSTMIEVTLTLTDEEKEYLNKNFVNGMYVEGFIRLNSVDKTAQCDMSIPFLGFYGDWDSAPMLDYDAFEIAEIEQDNSLLDDEKPRESVWATQAYSTYWQDNYVLPMGNYIYNQDDSDDVRQIYTEEEHSSISRYDDYYGVDEGNYMTSTGLKGLYAGLLRNARLVTCQITNAYTGALIYDKEIYRVNKAYSNGGRTTPGYVELELKPDDLGLVENGKYKMEFVFYFNEDSEYSEDNTFECSFYVDYTAPVLEDARIRYVDYTEGNLKKQRTYLDLDVYDNHYSMAALLCRIGQNNMGESILELATEYPTPIYDAKFNGLTTVSIEITDIIKDYGNELYIELDDYALNHSVWQLVINDAQSKLLPDSFELAGASSITLEKYKTTTIPLTWDKTLYPTANASNFTWKVSDTDVIAVKNGEVVGLRQGTATVTVSNGTQTKTVTVTVTDRDVTLSYPSVSFGTILNYAGVPVKASGMVEVNVEQQFTLEVVTEPWYYPLANPSISYKWESLNTDVAEVDNSGNVILKKKGTAAITATIPGTAYSASVILKVVEPFTVDNYSLNDYTGAGGVVYIPTDMNIMYIGEEAFRGNKSITAVIIPRSVTVIYQRAFEGCTNLKYVFFDGVKTQAVADADLTLIDSDAFAGCTSLEFVDFSNCKTFTASNRAFQGCTSLKFIKGIEKMGTAYNYAFSGCTSLIGSIDRDGANLVSEVTVTQTGTNKQLVIDDINNTSMSYIAEQLDIDIDEKKVTDVTDLTTLRITDIKVNNLNTIQNGITALDLSGLHVSGINVFEGDTKIKGVITDTYTAIGSNMFRGCSAITSLVLKTANIGASAFANCTGLKSVTFDCVGNVNIGASAFSGCGRLSSVTFTEGTKVRSIGSNAFASTSIETLVIPEGIQTIGSNIFSGNDLQATVTFEGAFSGVTFEGNAFGTAIVNVGSDCTVTDGAIYAGNKLLYVPTDKTEFTIPETVTEIGAYAFANGKITSIVIPASVTKINKGAFSGCSELTQVTFAENSQLKSIETDAFNGSKIGSITLPETVTYVGNNAFAYTSLTEFNFEPKNEATFGDYVFCGCKSLVEIALDENIKTMGDATFASCGSLKTVVMPAVTSLGMGTFYQTTNIASVTFPEGATTLGESTFFSYSFNFNNYSYTYSRYSSLTSVTFGSGVTEIGESVFVYCTALESIDLKNVTVIGANAFYGCSSLSTVTGLNRVTSIGDYAFYNCTAIPTLDLAEAKDIGIAAFRIDRMGNSQVTGYTSVSIPKAESIGNFAFYGGAEATVEIPETLLAGKETEFNEGTYVTSSFGAGVFAGSTNLTSITVASGNSDFISENGALYRIIEGGAYELVAYPSAKAAESFEIMDGTTVIAAAAMANLTANVEKVILPYSVDVIGVQAFFESGISTFEFLGVTAPILESEFNRESSDDINTGSGGAIYRGMFNENFETNIINYATTFNASATASDMTLIYPSNGTGYDNYVYRTYFGTKTASSPALVEEAKILVDNVAKFYTVDQINAMNSWEVNAENTKIVTEFAELVKTTHGYYNYNSISGSEVQLGLIGQANIDKLFAVEEALVTVKQHFGMQSSILSMEYTYKNEYVVGEKFDMSSLKLTVTYDDYYVDEVDYTEIELLSAYDRELKASDLHVEIRYGGEQRRLRITVKNQTTGGSGEQTPPETQPTQPEEGCNSALNAGITLMAAAMAIAVTLFIKRYRRNNK